MIHITKLTHPSPHVVVCVCVCVLKTVKSVPHSSLVSGECILLGSVSSQQRFGVKDIKALGASQL